MHAACTHPVVYVFFLLAFVGLKKTLNNSDFEKCRRIIEQRTILFDWSGPIRLGQICLNLTTTVLLIFAKLNFGMCDSIFETAVTRLELKISLRYSAPISL